MNAYEMEGFLLGKALPGDLLVGENNAAYLVRKLNEATALKAERDALAVERDAARNALASIYKTVTGELPEWSNWHAYLDDIVEEVGAALAAIEARFCGLLDHYGKVEPEQFNPEFADLYAKIVNRIFSSVMDNPSVTDLESLTDYLESSAENSRAYADMSMKFHAELRESK